MSSDPEAQSEALSRPIPSERALIALLFCALAALYAVFSANTYAGAGGLYAQPVHAAHVVDAVHGALPPGGSARPVPIIESRVTSLASAASPRPALPAGRSGSTR